MKRTTLITLSVLGLLQLFSATATAADYVTRAEYDALLQKVAKLEATMASMQTTQIDAIREEVATALPATRQVKPSSSIVDNVVDAIYVREQAINYPWMDSAKWNVLKKGMSPGEVVDVLGLPTTDEPSLHKRVDNVYTYEGRQPATGKRIVGKIRFLKKKVIEIDLPKL